METYDVVKRIFDHNIIYCLFPMIMTLIIFRKVLKKKVDFPEIFNWIRWFIIGYTVITTIVYLAGMTIDPEKYAFYNRATGPYAWAYWVILIGSLVFPLSLIYKPLGINPWYLLLVSILMKIGFYMERYTIILVSIHRDYLPSNWQDFSFVTLGIYTFTIIWLQGIVLALLVLGIFEFIKCYRKKASRYQ